MTIYTLSHHYLSYICSHPIVKPPSHPTPVTPLSGPQGAQGPQRLGGLSVDGGWVGLVPILDSRRWVGGMVYQCEQDGVTTVTMLIGLNSWFRFTLFQCFLATLQSPGRGALRPASPRFSIVPAAAFGDQGVRHWGGNRLQDPHVHRDGIHGGKQICTPSKYK